jgi:hypothetical protein
MWVCNILSHMRAQAAARAAQIVEPPPSTPATTDLEAAMTVTAVPEPPPEPSSEQLPPPLVSGADVSVPLAATEAVTTVVPEPPPEPSLEQPLLPFVPAQAPDVVPAMVTPLLELGSDMSDIEPEGVSETPHHKKKSSATKRKVTGQGSEGGPSKRRSGWKKAGNHP